jgi:beta-1,4-mannosyl-glycoprotein beta-1,4-N-acetylglucosaminyltransferase
VAVAVTTWSLTPFGFESELDILEIRLATLDPVVDVHVIAEAPVTHAGTPKPLHVQRADARGRFDRWRDKIRYVVVDDMPAGTDSRLPDRPLTAADSSLWRRENHQRNALERGCDGMADDDLVLLSDLDEIPSPLAFESAPAWLDHERAIVRPELPMHVGMLNWRWPRPLPVIARFMRGLALRELGPQRAREVDFGPIAAPGRDSPALYGWHLSYTGGIGAIQRKLRDFAHAELDRPPFNQPDHIAYCLATGADLFSRDDRQCEWVGLDQLPPYVAENTGRFGHMLVPEPVAA